MKNQLKETYLYCFPPLPHDSMQTMKKTKGTANFCIFIASNNVLYVRGYHKYYRGDIVEKQRYVFAPEGYVRYGADQTGTHWKAMSEFREPTFISSMGYHDNSYRVMNTKSYRNSCMRYSELDNYKGKYLMMYLRFYYQHRNVEYLIKSDYSWLVERFVENKWGTEKIDWKSNNLLKMLKLNRNEFKLLSEDTERYDEYTSWRSKYPNLKPQEIFNVIETFGWEQGTASILTHGTGLKIMQLCRYLKAQNVTPHDWLDYLNECNRLGYNTQDTVISQPKNLRTAHDRVTSIRQIRETEAAVQKFKENYKGREILNYKYGDYIIRQPKSIDEIVAEGEILSHCVGGYAERHANGALHIMFLRKASEPDEPFYTVEVSTDGKIIQCRGYKNNWVERGGTEKPQEIKDFEKEYQKHLDAVFARQKRRKTA